MTQGPAEVKPGIHLGVRSPQAPAGRAEGEVGGFLGDQGLPVGSEGHRAQQMSKDQVEDDEVDGTGTGSSPLVERSRSRHNEGQEQGLGCVWGEQGSPGPTLQR